MMQFPPFVNYGLTFELEGIQLLLYTPYFLKVLQSVARTYLLRLHQNQNILITGSSSYVTILKILLPSFSRQHGMIP